MTDSKKDIRQLSFQEIESHIVQLGLKPYVAKQIYEWLWKKSARTFYQMSNISAGLRSHLNDKFSILPLSPAETQFSTDGTIKTGFRLYDGNVIEGVLIPSNERMTACVSTQVGCSLTCRFCATGKLERKRNLSTGEIYDQVVELGVQAKNNYGRALTNIVYMGMGEPLLNYRNVLQSVEKITSPHCLGMSPKRITVSTAGISAMIRKLGDDMVRFKLSLSLHAANDAKRSSIMPINEHNSLGSLKKALKYFHGKTGQKITFEYIIFKNFNDSTDDAKELVKFCEHLPCKVNIIEYNPIDGSEFERADESRVEKFANYLKKNRIGANIRRSRGADIDAACGQLANKNTISRKDGIPIAIGTLG